MSDYLVTCWDAPRAGESSEDLSLRVRRASSWLSPAASVENGVARATVSVPDMAARARLLAQLRSSFSDRFRVEPVVKDPRLAALEARADAAAATVGCSRIREPLGLLHDAMGRVVGARLSYSGPALALRKALRDSGVGVERERVRIDVDAYDSSEPAPAPESPPKGGGE